MKKHINIKDLEYLAVGAGILGSGGGGNTNNALPIAKRALEKYGAVELISIDTLSKDDLIVPLAFMGAPLVFCEKLPNIKELQALIKEIEQYFSKKVTALMPAEIGGANAFTPFSIAAKMSIPILDADLLSRAFPQLQMNSAALQNLPLCPAFLADSHLNTVIVNTRCNFKLEALARNITIEMGSSAALAVSIMDGQTVKKGSISGTVTQAIELGKIVVKAQENNLDPIGELVKDKDVRLVGSGTITDIDQAIKSGFLKGTVTIEDQESRSKILIIYENENLLVYINNKIVTTTPDIITVLDSQTGMPITTDAFLYGLRVIVIAIKANKIWQSKKGLELVGPQAFGYDFDYNAI